jgi:hypothetical protein
LFFFEIEFVFLLSLDHLLVDFLGLLLLDAFLRVDLFLAFWHIAFLLIVHERRQMRGQDLDDSFTLPGA